MCMNNQLVILLKDLLLNLLIKQNQMCIQVPIMKKPKSSYFVRFRYFPFALHVFVITASPLLRMDIADVDG